MQAEKLMSCADLRPVLAVLVDDVEGASSLDPSMASHFDTCLRCQAELAQYRKMRRAMLSLRLDSELADSAHLEEILELMRPPASVHKIHSNGRRKAYIGGIAAAATAGAAGAIVIASKLSRQRIAS